MPSIQLREARQLILGKIGACYNKNSPYLKEHLVLTHLNGTNTSGIRMQFTLHRQINAFV